MSFESAPVDGLGALTKGTAASTRECRSVVGSVRRGGLPVVRRREESRPWPVKILTSVVTRRGMAVGVDVVAANFQLAPRTLNRPVVEGVFLRGGRHGRFVLLRGYGLGITILSETQIFGVDVQRVAFLPVHIIQSTWQKFISKRKDDVEVGVPQAKSG